MVEAMPVLYEVSERTYREFDRLLSGTCMHLSNKQIAPPLQQLMWLIGDKVVYSLHSLLFCGWDGQAGPIRREPRLTLEKFTASADGKHLANEPLEGKVKEDTRFKARVQRLFGSDVPPRQLFHLLDPYGNRMYDEEPIGGPSFDVCDPTEYMIDPSAGWRGVAGARWIARQRRFDASHLYARYSDEKLYPGAIDRLKKFEGWSDELTVNQAQAEIYSYLKLPTSCPKSQTGLVTEFFRKP
jgi:hypothetical protein